MMRGIRLKVTVRQEQPEDFDRVETICREAFWNLYIPGAEEHAVVHKLHHHKDTIHDLTAVVEVDGEIEGAIFYTPSQIITPDNHEVETISFGPVFISPAYQRQGLGKELITTTIKWAQDLGYRAIITLGYPYHYEPYGFKGGKHYRLSMPDGLYYQGLLVLPLYEDALSGVEGYVVFSDALEVTPEEVDQFDQRFPQKEKRHQPSQDDYRKAIMLLDE